MPELRYGYAYAHNVDLPSLCAAREEAETFFQQSITHKQQYTNAVYPEYGYRAIQNKQQVMLRDRLSFPHNVALAEELHQLAIQYLQQISHEMQWDPAVLLNLITPTAFPETGLTASCMRLNHYKAENDQNADPILSAVHEDLVLLTFVCPTNVPGLEIYDFVGDGEWLDVEAQQNPQDVIVMAGEVLAKISNNYYLPASHRVRRPNQDRTSLVYQLRPRDDVILDSKLLTSPITGDFKQPFQISGQAYLKKERAKRISVNESY